MGARSTLSFQGAHLNYRQQQQHAFIIDNNDTVLNKTQPITETQVLYVKSWKTDEERLLLFLECF